VVVPALDFTLPAHLEAATPPEARGLTRDAVRMMVARRHDGSIVHANFFDLPSVLAEGDAVVVNTSGTLAAELAATDASGEALAVRLSTRLPAELWTVELRRDAQAYLGAHAGQELALEAGGSVSLLAPYSAHPGGVRLWVAAVALGEPLLGYLSAHGTPIRYGYVHGAWPIAMYQNVYATEPGSAEMPSAGRPFTPEVLTRLVARGVSVIPVLLHTGVASLEASEAPYPEYFRVSATAARRINETRRAGGTVLAVGTTVVRALETVVDERGTLSAGSGWTETVVTFDRIVRSVDGLLTGWHEPEASHLAMLEAIAGRALLERCYAEAVDHEYLWHEFGDVHLVLP
ncbi:MAG TPA: S-adenosylmethionine:tRNA ribosyltransferase-isomerase, partial [Acidimicrobiales bacterium]|nr:S-adenosylmethionine:tRNA ribosyltransferase-isomerase [Acidimicrobiales bacterium]